MPQYDIDAQEILYENFPIAAAAAAIAEGDFVSRTSAGYVRQLNVADDFAGVAVQAEDNSSGAAGDIQLRVMTKCLIRGLSVTNGLLTTPIGTPVYATGVATFTTEGSSAIQVGITAKGISAGVLDVLVLGDGVRH